MWKLGKKFLSAVLATALVASLAVSAAAAAPAVSAISVKPVYSVSVSKDTLSLVSGGKVVGTYALKNTKISLMTDKNKELLVCYNGKDGQFRAVTLGAQAALSLAGTMDSLTLVKALDDKIAVTLGATGSVGTLAVETPNPVVVQGKVTALTISAPAKVTVASGATVSKTTTSDKKAVITVEKGANAAAPVAGKPAAPAKPAASSKAATNGSEDIRLTVKALNASKGDTLADLVDALNDNVKAVDNLTKDVLTGTSKFTSNSSATLDGDSTYSFTFTPDDTTLAPVRGSVKIYAESGAGDITLTIEKKGLLVGTKAGEKQLKLKDLTKALNDSVYATDENGNDVEGKASWKSSGSDADSGRTYEYTFKPKSSRYNSETGSVTLD